MYHSHHHNTNQMSGTNLYHLLEKNPSKPSITTNILGSPNPPNASKYPRTSNNVLELAFELRRNIQADELKNWRKDFQSCANNGKNTKWNLHNHSNHQLQDADGVHHQHRLRSSSEAPKPIKIAVDESITTTATKHVKKPRPRAHSDHSVLELPTHKKQMKQQPSGNTNALSIPSIFKLFGKINVGKTKKEQQQREKKAAIPFDNCQPRNSIVQSGLRASDYGYASRRDSEASKFSMNSHALSLSNDSSFHELDNVPPIPSPTTSTTLKIFDPSVVLSPLSSTSSTSTSNNNNDDNNKGATTIPVKKTKTELTDEEKIALNWKVRNVLQMTKKGEIVCSKKTISINI
eukprot:m.15392 g.15392  ORF g.15392 m.15392 type:complete len:347 (+) comp4465_c0_seq1:238-1278(+)